MFTKLFQLLVPRGFPSLPAKDGITVGVSDQQKDRRRGRDVGQF